MTFAAGVVTGLIIGAVIAVLLAVGAAHRKSEQLLTDIILEGEEKIVQSKDLEKRIKAMPWTGTDLNDGVDISCTITAIDAARWEPRRVKVYQPNADARHGSPHGVEVYYGQRFSGAIFDHIELVDPPKTAADLAWIREHLMVRIAPGGKLRLSKDMVPHGTHN